LVELEEGSAGLIDLDYHDAVEAVE